MARSVHRRRLIAAATACAAIAASLTACTTGGGSGGSSSSQTLTIAEWTNPTAITFTQQVDAAFEKAHPGVTIKLEQAPTANNAWPTLQNSLLAAKSVDLLAQFPPNPEAYPPANTNLKPSGTAALIANGQFVNLANQPFMSRFDQTSQQFAMGYNGGVYGVMVAEYVNNTGMYYKKDILAKYGLSVPKTLTEFVDDMATLKAHGVTPIFVAGKDGYQNIAWAGIINQLMMQDKPASAVDDVYKARAVAFWNGTQNWNSALYQQAAQNYAKIMNYIEPSASGVPAATAATQWAVQTDNYPFLIDGSWDGNTIAQTAPSLNFGFMAIPGTDNASWNRAALAPDLSWAIPTFSKHQSLAEEYLDFFTSPAEYAQWVAATGSLSTEPAVPTAKAGWTDWLAANVAQGYMNQTQPWTPTGAPTAAGGPTLTAVQPFGSQSMTDALNQSATAYSKALGH